jgi:hypothetical protein
VDRHRLHTVTKVIDGQRMHLIGVDMPEAGSGSYATEAT